MMGLAVACLGVFILQDGVASIAFYNGRESWLKNHSWRVTRSLAGLALIILGVLIERKGI